MRLADGFITMQAGPEIGVASTKAFTTSVLDQYSAGPLPGRSARPAQPGGTAQHAQALARLPDIVGRVLADDQQYESLAVELSTYANFLYLGRGINYRSPWKARSS
jgi:glucosamine--fructose-6-phosphate aminotransferase (isomerizing)